MATNRNPKQVAAAAAASSGGSPPPKAHPFVGQIGAFFFFSSPVTQAEEIAAIYNLGPNYQPTEIE